MSFPIRRDLSDLPEDDEHGWPFPKGRLLLHSTTEEALDDILRDGLRPRCETNCPVWDDDDDKTMPYQIRENDVLRERICDCRSEHVYFWDSYQEGVYQGIATVAYLRTGNPVLLVVNAEGLNIEPDPEINEEANYREEGEATSWMHEGAVPPERVLCHCHPKFPPTVGDLFCNLRHDDCALRLDSPYDLYDFYAEPSNWECECRDELFEHY